MSVRISDSEMFNKIETNKERERKQMSVRILRILREGFWYAYRSFGVGEFQRCEVAGGFEQLREQKTQNPRLLSQQLRRNVSHHLVWQKTETFSKMTSQNFVLWRYGTNSKLKEMIDVCLKWEEEKRREAASSILVQDVFTSSLFSRILYSVFCTLNSTRCAYLYIDAWKAGGSLYVLGWRLQISNLR